MFTECKLLWEFLDELLKDPTKRDLVQWENKAELVFIIMDPDRLAQEWGAVKHRTDMTYDKFSRALRYYYKQKIVTKVPGTRFAFK